MTTTKFSRWRTRIERDGVKAIPRIMYVTGSEQVLIEEVLQDVWKLVNPPEFDRVRFTVGENSPQEIWTSIHQYSIDREIPRVVQVRDAQRLTNWEHLQAWEENHSWFGKTYLLFVASDGELPDKELNLGTVIDCNTPSDSDLLSWVQSKTSNLDNTTADYLLTRTGCDLLRVADVCSKVALFQGKPGIAVINELCHPGPLDTFVESLLALDRRSAVLAVSSVPIQDYSRVIEVLDTRLDLLNRVRGITSPRELASIPGVSSFLAKKYSSIALDYDSRRILRRRRVLSVASMAIARGASEGVLESVVALW